MLHTAMVWHASPVQNSEMVLYCRLTWWKNVVAAREKGPGEHRLGRVPCPGDRCSVREPRGGLHFPQTGDEGPGAWHGPGVLACSPRTKGGAHVPSQQEANVPQTQGPALTNTSWVQGTPGHPA